MSSISDSSFLLYAIAGLAIGCLHLLLFTRKRNPLPPGPPSFPWIGNIQCLFTSPDWITYTDWYQKYDSDIIHVNIAGTSIIILNTVEAATELLERRSSNFSSRPEFTMLHDLIGWKWNFVTMPYGAEWRACRKLFTSMFNPSNPEQHEPQTLHAARELLVRLHESPKDYPKLLRKMAGATILSVAYGFDVKAVQDSVHTDNAERALDGFIAASVPGKFLVDVMPWLRYVPSWLPGASFQSQARIWKGEVERLLHGPYDAMRASNEVEPGETAPCFVSRCLAKLDDEQDSNQGQEWLIKQTAGAMYMAGTDTTVIALLSFILAMVKYPHFQKKAQEQLDRVVGSDRLPDFTDRDNLPYIQAVVNEVLRWQPVSPPCLPHLSAEEDIYNGYYIPQNATIIANAWAMLHDERYFSDPYSFNPDRYIDSASGQLNLEILEPTAGFGFGRRICPGRHMALSEIWITVASVLAVFDISNAVDENGQLIDPPVEYITNTLQNRPRPFKCSFKLRSPERLALIKGTTL